MAGISTVPKSIVGFNTYIGRSDDYLQAGGEVSNGSRLLFQEDELAMWHETRVQWDAVYALYKDSVNVRTRATSANLHDILDGFMVNVKGAHLIQRLESSPDVTSQDLEVFNIRSTSGASQSSEEPISISVMPEINVLGGGRVSIICRHALVEKASASIPHGANMLEYKYQVGGTMPTDPNDAAMTLGMSTKAKFQLDLGAQNRASFLYIFFRWSNSRHQEHCGPWTSCQSVVIT